MNMFFQLANKTYKWIEHWVKLPNSDEGWAHHGIASLANSQILAGHSTRPELYFLNASGSVVKMLPLEVSEIHHLCPKYSANDATVLICDLGDKDLDDRYRTEPRVVEFDFEGTLRKSISKNQLNYQESQTFKPTSTAYDALNQRTWISDGYGSHLVHCLDDAGMILFTLDGSTGCGRFDCPHTVFIDGRNDQSRVLISDRSNHRVQVYDLDGNYIDTMSIPSLRTPSAFAVLDDHLLVVELEARIHVLDRTNRPVQCLFDGSDNAKLPGWPNRIRNEKLVSPGDLEIGKLNSPHSICIDLSGNIYLSEWMIGDRFIKLERCAP